MGKQPFVIIIIELFLKSWCFWKCWLDEREQNSKKKRRKEEKKKLTAISLFVMVASSSSLSSGQV